MTYASRSHVIHVRGGASYTPPSSAQLNYWECDKCGAMIMEAGMHATHTEWHDHIDTDTALYKTLLDQANELVADLKAERARMPRMR